MTVQKSDLMHENSHTELSIVFSRAGRASGLYNYDLISRCDQIKVEATSFWHVLYKQFVSEF